MAAVAVVLVVAVVVVAIRVASRARRASQAEASRVASDYLRRWHEGAWAQLATLVDRPPADLVATHTATAAALNGATWNLTRTAFSAGAHRGSARFQAKLVVRGVGPWTYTGRLPLVRTAGHWRVAWSPAVLHPDLRPGLRLVVVRTWPARAPVLAPDGSALPTNDADLSAVVGGVGPATAQRASELGDTYVAGDPVGLSGIEAGAERELAGRPTADVRLVDGANHTLKVLLHVDGAAGRPVKATLDPETQTAAERALNGVSKPAALVAIDTDTGNVRAAVSRPTGGYPRALQGKYPPGSTFKIVTTAAALESGHQAGDTLPCPAEKVVEGRHFQNAEGEALGTVPFKEAFAQSCNTAFINLAESVSDDALVQAASQFGFNTDPQLGAAAFEATFPRPTTKVEHAAEAIGQGKVEVSPVHMAAVAAAVANGNWHPPRLIEGAPVKGAHPLDPNVINTLRDFMRAVVTDGTGKAANVPGSPVAGKTGTAEFGSGNPPPTHAWFVGFRDRLAFAVIVEGGGFGRDVAAPIAGKFLSSL